MSYLKAGLIQIKFVLASDGALCCLVIAPPEVVVCSTVPHVRMTKAGLGGDASDEALVATGPPMKTGSGRLSAGPWLDVRVAVRA